MKKSKYFVITHILLLFCIGQVLLYFLMFSGRNLVPFHAQYYKEFHTKFFGKEELLTPSQNFLESLSVYDAQWYLTLAENGYAHPTSQDISNPQDNPKVLQFVFFPFYPFILSIVHQVIPSIEAAAFFFSIFLQLITFISLYYVVSKMTTNTIAIKTSLLLFTFPFSIFFRSYYTEILFLFLLLWFCYFTYKHRFFFAAVMLGLLLITRGTGMLLYPLFGVFLWKSYREKTLSVTQLVVPLLIAAAPLLTWIWFGFMQTGDPFIFISIKQYWLRTAFPFLRIVHTFGAFPFLPFHGFHGSKIDSVMIVVTGFMVYKSRKTLSPLLWWISFCLWITPLLVHDTMSFSRYQSVNVPLFIYLATILKGKLFTFTTAMFCTLLIIVSILFLNFYWIG